MSLLSHRSRITKFRRAMEEVVTERSLVVDLGTGSGVLAMMAARMGARRVIAVDVEAESIRYAQLAARRNGLESRIEFVVCHFEDFVPDEPADIVVCEMLDSALLVEQQVPAVRHSLRRVLRRGGVMLPRWASVYMVPVSCAQLWERFHVDGLEFPPVPQTIDRGISVDLADLQQVLTIDFNSSEIPTVVDAVLDFRIVQEGLCHGLLALLEAGLSHDIRLQMEDGWRELLLPFSRPCHLYPGQHLKVYIRYVPGDVSSLNLDYELAD
ncbi:MAG: 50S ribosomal protein L11 methyltransferase [Candidatus Thorarchaeota archaeon]